MSCGQDVNLTSPSVIRTLLADENVRPRKRWGQHFLADKNTLERIVEAAKLSKEHGVLEVGAGLGTLTRELACSAGVISAVEIDPIMNRILKKTLEGLDNVFVTEGDFLKERMDALLSPLGDRPISVVANVPYYITTPILERLFEYRDRIETIIVLVQKEFALRLSSLPNRESYGALSLFAQYHAEVKSLFNVPRTVFYPPPEVDSMVVSLKMLPPKLQPEEERLLFLCTRAAFAARRKTLFNALSNGLNQFYDKEQVNNALVECKIDPNRRGETLSLDEFIGLALAFSRMG